MMRRAKYSKPKGFAEKIITALFTLIFMTALIGSFFLMPIAERIAEETVCKPGTIANDTWGRRRATSCLDKKTGQKIDVSLMQIFGCCPVILVLFSIIIYAIFMKIAFKNSVASDKNSL